LKMNEDVLLNPEALVDGAKTSKHGEAYKTLDKSSTYRIGVGARLGPLGNYHFFVEILVYLCPTHGKLDLETLEKRLVCLRKLEKRGYSLTCQDGECISCEAIVPVERLVEEYAAVKSLIEGNAAFNTG